MIGDTNYGRAKERGSTAAVMAAANPVLAPRELAATVDGTDTVLRMGDGVTAWNDLPDIYPHPEGSGGGALAIEVLESWSGDCVVRSSGEGGIDEIGIDWATPSNPSGGAAATWMTPDAFGKLILGEAGWYEVAVFMTVQFLSSAAVTYVRIAFDAGPSSMGNIEEFLTPTVATGGAKVAARLVNLGRIYSDGTAYIRPQVRWTTGIYDSDVSSAYLLATVSRID